MSQTIEQSIIQTLTYFSVASFPLTKEELYRHLWRAPQIDQLNLESELSDLVAAGRICEKWGFYFLPNEEKNIEIRRQAVIFNDQKLSKARRAAGFIAWVPFLKAIMVCNSVGREVATRDSDIDLYIIAQSGRLWLVRAFTNSILRLFGLRTYGRKERDRICLSFFVTTEALDLSAYRAVNEDIHFAYWLQQMVPVYDPEEYYAKMLVANTWVGDLLPNRKIKLTAPSLRPGRFGKATKRFFEIAWRGAYGNLVEKQAKEIQRLKLKPFNDRANKADNGIVITDAIIKLHEHDARLRYREEWLKKQNRTYVATT